MTAARRYREITAELTAVVDYIQRVDTQRLAELANQISELDEQMAKAAERSALTRLGVALRWEAALEELWSEQWMTLRPLPDPDPAAGQRDLDLLDAEVEASYQALLDALRRRTIGWPQR